MRGLCLTAARFVVSAWVGAATLFVVVLIFAVNRAGLESSMRWQLVLRLFPIYYAFGFTLVPAGLVASLLARRHHSVGRMRMWLCYTLLTLAVIVMAADYLAVYQPLTKMAPPSTVTSAETDDGADPTVIGAVPAEFQTYHRLSELINTAHVSLACVAALLLCLPGRRRPVE